MLFEKESFERRVSTKHKLFKQKKNLGPLDEKTNNYDREIVTLQFFFEKYRNYESTSGIPALRAGFVYFVP